MNKKTKTNKKRTIEVKVPASKAKKLAGTTFVCNNLDDESEGMFFQNSKKGKKYKKKETDLICQNYTSNLISGLISETKGHHFVFEASIKDLEKLVKEAKKMKKLKGAKVGCFFKHLSPELSFAFKDE